MINGDRLERRGRPWPRAQAPRGGRRRPSAQPAVPAGLNGAVANARVLKPLLEKPLLEILGAEAYVVPEPVVWDAPGAGLREQPGVGHAEQAPPQAAPQGRP